MRPEPALALDFDAIEAWNAAVVVTLVATHSPNMDPAASVRIAAPTIFPDRSAG